MLPSVLYNYTHLGILIYYAKIVFICCTTKLGMQYYLQKTGT